MSVIINRREICPATGWVAIYASHEASDESKTPPYYVLPVAVWAVVDVDGGSPDDSDLIIGYASYGSDGLSACEIEDGNENFMGYELAKRLSEDEAIRNYYIQASKEYRNEVSEEEEETEENDG